MNIKTGQKYTILIICFTATLIFFSIYSYSHVDLNLTLSGNQFYQVLQNRLIYLGYYQRPLSAFIYLVLLTLFFVFYYYILRLVKLGKLSFKRVLFLISTSLIVLFFSYPAFSHDIFNYMFDARIVTKYFSNPYYYKATDFPGDLWIRFMHWTHRTYPYGPTWLFLTLPFSYLGLGKFVLTLFNFKLMFSLFHLGNLILIGKILKKIAKKSVLEGVVFYGLNPLILIESLLSPHNETAMLFFLLFSLYFLFIKKRISLGITHLLFSVGVKFITISLLPYFVLDKFIKRKIDVNQKLQIVTLILLIPIILEIIYREPYPWYFIILIGTISLIVGNSRIKVLITGLSLGSLLRYAPYIYKGDYNLWTQQTQRIVFFTPLLLSFLWVLLITLKERRIFLWRF